MAVSITLAQQTLVSNLYVAFFGRAPDGEGLGYWARELAGTDTVAGKSATEVANAMFATAPARTYYPAMQTNEQIVGSFYLNVLGRTADAAGLKFWTDKLSTKGATVGSVINEMIDAVVNWKASGDATLDAAGLKSQNLFNNKAAVALYAGQKNLSVSAATTALNGVTDVASTVTAAKAAIDATPAAVQNFSLTTGMDNVPASTGLKISGIDNAGGVAGGQTFNTGDVVNGADEVAITFSGNSTVAADVNNTTSFKGTMLASASINGALYDNVTNILNAGGGLANTLTVTNGDLATTYGIAGDTSAAGISVGVRGAQLVGTSDAVKFSVAGAGSVVVGAAGTAAVVSQAALTSSSAGVEKVTVATSGTNVFGVTASAANLTDGVTLEVTGSGNNTINATGMTQVALYDLSTATGNNTLNVVGTLTTGDVVKGGSGTDVLRMNNANTIANVSVTGVETLRLSTGSSTGNVLFTGGPSFTTVRVDGDTSESGAQTLTSVGAVASIVYKGDGLTVNAGTQQQFNGLTIANSFSGSADTVAVTVDNGGVAMTANGYALNGVSVNGVETLSVTVADTTAGQTLAVGGLTDNTLSSLTATSAGAVNFGSVNATNAAGTAGTLTNIDLSNVKGSVLSTITLASNDVASVAAISGATGTGGTTVNIGSQAGSAQIIYTGAAGIDTINATNGTNGGNGNYAGVLVVDGKGGADVIIGGTGNDVITGGEGGDSITGGSGNDSIILTETVSAIDTVVFDQVFTAGNASADTITGFAMGTDLIDIAFNVTNGTTAATAALVAIAPVAVASNNQATANDVIFTFNGVGDILAAGTTTANAVANAVTALTSGADFSGANIATNDSLVLVMNDGTNTFVFHYVADATAATTTAADLELIGVINGTTTAPVTGNII